jgi:ATP/maltotriose-dependent transcriptional regulator MalT
VAEARDLLRRSVRLARTTEQRVALAHTLVAEARVESRLGNGERAREAADEAFALMEATQWRVAECLLRADLAVLELGHADAAGALAVAQDAVSLPRPDESPRRLWAVPTLAQVLVALGRHDEARRALDELDADVGARSRSLRADAMRARAQVLAATGDLDAAEAAIGAAESEHREMANRWELARTLLVAGEIHRRSRHRARARAAFGEALTLFSLLGAGTWARAAREQMKRSGTGHREGGLTPAQRGVAELVATGLTNRQVGDRLSMSVHTVEAHLSEVYRSLGIRSRRQLAPLLGTPAIRDTASPIRDRATS